MEPRGQRRGRWPSYGCAITARGFPRRCWLRSFFRSGEFPLAGEASPEGAGLGLAITERAVSAHGGKVRAMNAADGGLIVEIELPL